MLYNNTKPFKTRCINRNAFLYDVFNNWLWNLRGSTSCRLAGTLNIKPFCSSTWHRGPCQTFGCFRRRLWQNINDGEQKMKKRLSLTGSGTILHRRLYLLVCVWMMRECVSAYVCVWRERVCDLWECLCVNWRAVVLRDHPFVSIWPSGCKHFPDTSHTHSFTFTNTHATDASAKLPKVHRSPHVPQMNWLQTLQLPLKNAF